MNGPNWVLILLLGFFGLVNYPFLSGGYVPEHDTLDMFLQFHYLYSGLLFENEIPQWNPYMLYGIPTVFSQINAVSPAGYLCMLIGKAFNVTDVLFLFRLSIVADHLIFILGIYILSKLLYSNIGTILLVGFGAISLSLWYGQIHHCFRFFSYIPFMLYFLFLFFDKHRPEYFWLTGIMAVFGLMGNSSNIIPIWLFVLLLFSIPFIWKKPRIFNCLLDKSAINISFFITFLVVASICLLFIANSTNLFLITTSGRDIFTGQLSLENFVYQGQMYDLKILLPSYFLGWNGRIDDTTYIGLLPLILFVLAIIKVRDTFFYGLVMASFGMLLLSIGGIFTIIGAHLPLMSFFKHISLIHGVTGILLLFGAGFGFEYLINSRKLKYYIFLAFAFFCLIEIGGRDISSELLLKPLIAFDFFKQAIQNDSTLVLGHLPVIDLFQKITQDKSVMALFWLRTAIYLIGCLLCILVIIKNNQYSSMLATLILLICFLFDVVSYRWITVGIPPIAHNTLELSNNMTAHKFEYQKQRTFPHQGTKAQIDAISLIHKLENRGVHYVSIYAYAQQDNCLTTYRTYFFPIKTHHLFSAREIAYPDMTPGKSYPHGKKDQSFMNVLGCRRPKIRFVKDAYYSSSIEDAGKMIKKTHKLDKVLIISNGTNESRGQSRNTSFRLKKESAKYHLIKFSANEIVIDVATNDSVWLVYADSYAPGWHAEVDGHPIPIEEEYLAFIAVKVEPGKHRIRFWYSSWITMLSYLVAGIGVVWAGLLLYIFINMVIVSPKQVNNPLWFFAMTKTQSKRTCYN